VGFHCEWLLKWYLDIGGADLHLGTLNIPEERFEDDEKVVMTRYKPLGVVGAICPWNCEFAATRYYS